MNALHTHSHQILFLTDEKHSEEERTATVYTTNVSKLLRLLPNTNILTTIGVIRMSLCRKVRLLH